MTRYAAGGFGDVSEADYRDLARDYLGADDFDRAQHERAEMEARSAFLTFAWQCARLWAASHGVALRVDWGR